MSVLQAGLLGDIKLVRLEVDPGGDISARNPILRLGGCDTAEVDLKWPGFVELIPQRSLKTSRSIPTSRVHGETASGARLEGRAIPKAARWSTADGNEAGLMFSNCELVFSRKRSRALAVLLHGFDHVAGAPRIELGEYVVALTRSKDHCADKRTPGWLVMARSDGGSIARPDGLRLVRKAERLLSFGAGRFVQATIVVWLDADGESIRIHRDYPGPHPRSMAGNWLPSKERFVAHSALDFMAAAWPTYEQAQQQYDVDAAARYLLRTFTTNELDWQARDCCISVEAMVKARFGRGGTLLQNLEQLQREVGLDGCIRPDENGMFKDLRNLFAHQGTFGPVPDAELRNRIQTTAWLQTYAARHIAAVHGWQGPVLDRASVDWTPRNIRGRRFVRPRH